MNVVFIVFVTAVYRYKSGPVIDVSFLPDSSENVVLILNGRDNSTVSTTVQWLKDLPNIPVIQVSVEV